MHNKLNKIILSLGMNYLDSFSSSFKDKYFPMLPLKLTMNMGDQATINKFKHRKETMKSK